MVPACADNRGYHRESRSHHNPQFGVQRETEKEQDGWNHRLGHERETLSRSFHLTVKTTTSSDETEDFRISVTWIANAPSSQLGT